MTHLNWNRVQVESALKTNGAVSVVDESEWRKSDAAARWLERNDRPKTVNRHLRKSKKKRAK